MSCAIGSHTVSECRLRRHCVSVRWISNHLSLEAVLAILKVIKPTLVAAKRRVSGVSPSLATFCVTLIEKISGEQNSVALQAQIPTHFIDQATHLVIVR